jgi:hypothetical protein
VRCFQQFILLLINYFCARWVCIFSTKYFTSMFHNINLPPYVLPSEPSTFDRLHLFFFFIHFPHRVHKRAFVHTDGSWISSAVAVLIDHHVKKSQFSPFIVQHKRWIMFHIKNPMNFPKHSENERFRTGVSSLKCKDLRPTIPTYQVSSEKTTWLWLTFIDEQSSLISAQVLLNKSLQGRGHVSRQIIC